MALSHLPSCLVTAVLLPQTQSRTTEPAVPLSIRWQEAPTRPRRKRALALTGSGHRAPDMLPSRPDGHLERSSVQVVVRRDNFLAPGFNPGNT